MRHVKTIRSLPSALLSFYLRSLWTSVSSIQHKIDFKTAKLTKKCQVTVYTKSMGDIPLNQNSVYGRFALR